MKHIYILIFLITFLESLVLIGLFLPGSLLMYFLGFLIGKKNINIYLIFFMGFCGCFLGDITSYFLGRFIFNKYLYDIKKKIIFYTKYGKNIFYLFDKYIFLAILIGRFIGPLRSFILFISGMLNISINKIFLPSILSIFLWLFIYPTIGILTNVIINIPNSIFFSLYLLFLFFMLVMYIYITYDFYLNNSLILNKFSNLKLKNNIYYYIIIVIIIIIIYIFNILINDSLIKTFWNSIIVLF